MKFFKLLITLCIVLGSLLTSHAFATELSQCELFFASPGNEVDPGVFRSDSDDDLSDEDVGLSTTYYHGSPQIPFELPLHSAQHRLGLLSANGQLLHQSDARLANRKLLNRGPGLCSVACAVNSLHALFETIGFPTTIQQSADYWAHKIIEIAFNRTNTNAITSGLSLKNLTFVLPQLVQEMSSNSKSIEMTYFELGPYYFGEDAFNTNARKLVMLSVTVGSQNHAINLIGINPQKKRIAFVESNSPKVVHVVNYVLSTYNNRKTINLHWDGIFSGAENGYVKGILRLELK